MIENTFLFLPGVGEKTEQKIWQQGITNWNEFLETSNVKGLGDGRKVHADEQIVKAKKSVREGKAKFFTDRLPKSAHWRLYNKFRDETVFLDIETSGGYGYITVIGLFDGYDVKHFVKGANMEKTALKEELEKYSLIATFNGRSFDIPVINKYFKDVVPEIPHMDLRHVCSQLGLTGGLKKIEKELDLERETLVDGMAGGDAVILWDKFQATRNKKYLKQLLQYNAEDIINLKPLAEYVFEELKTNVFVN